MSKKESHAKYWYFPSNDPNQFIRCEWNEKLKRYDLHCQAVPKDSVHPNLKAALTRVYNAIENYDLVE